MSVVGVLLAGGAGRRFGSAEHKLLVDLGGRPLLRWALDAMREVCERCVVVQGAVDLRAVCPPGVAVVDNDAWDGGLATSLRCGLAWAGEVGATAAVVGLADAPGVPAAAWRLVAETAPEAPLVVASFGGQRHPPVRLAASLWGELPRFGESGARLLFDRPDALAIACPGEARDVDTRGDLASWRAAGVPA